MLLILVWAIVISFAIFMYVLLDGFDLGIGILFPWIKSHQERDIMISTILPVWDGNETWLVFGGASLYAAFPLAYSTLLPALYLPLILMLVALIFRGIAFEFRFRVKNKSRIWDISFAAGSITAAFSQGLIVGTFVQGFGHSLPVNASAYSWFTPFSVMTGIAVIIGYALLGSSWLIIQTVGELQERMYRIAKRSLIALTVMLIIVSLWTPFIEPSIMTRWFSLPNIFYLAPLPVLSGATLIYNFYSLNKRNVQNERLPFLLTTLLFIFSYLGFCISDWPYIIPHAVTLWDAASPPSSLKFTIVGVIILLPFLLGYTFYSYHVFRGKVTQTHEY